MNGKPTCQDFEQSIKERDNGGDMSESEELLAATFHLNPDPMAISELVTEKITHANPAFAQWTGYSSDESIGASMMDLRLWVNPADRSAIIDAVKSAEEVSGAEVLMRQRNGQVRNVLCSARIIEMRQERYLLILVHDITDRKRSEAALKENERKFRLITEKMRDIVWMADMNLRTLYITPSVRTVLGFRQEEHIPLTAEEQMTPNSLAVAYDTLARELAIEQQGYGDPDRTVKLLLEYYHRDGSTRWLETTVSGIRNEQGMLTGIHGASRDITEQKRTQEALQESEELYTRLVDTIPDVVVRTDLDGTVLFINNYALQISGYTRDELEGRNMLTFISPGDRERVIHNTALMMHGRLGPKEYRMIMKDGREVPFEVNGDVLRYGDGTPFGLVNVCRDISERKRAEEESRRSEEMFRKIFMTSPDLIGITRMEDGMIVDVNMGFEEITGWKRSEVIGRTSLDINFWVNPADRALMVKELQAGRDVVHRETTFRTKDGSVCTGIYSARFIHIADQLSLIFVMQDITELKQLEEDRRKLEQQLFQSQKMDAIGQLAGGVAHDFNNMLSVIIGQTEMALETIDPSEPLHRSLQSILTAGIRSADLTRQLLAFARKQTVIPKVLDLNDAVTATLKMLQRLIGENVTLVWMPGQKLWHVRIDPSQLDQLLANLTVNARDALNKTGKITIETSNAHCNEAYCSIHPECVPGDYVMLAVSDDGYGMEGEILKNIFEPFFTTKKEGQGTGLGLATVYGIVRQNGGFISVHSDPGLGTTFQIYLPRFMDEAVEAADEKEEMKLAGGTETILIVEDEEAVLTLSRDVLDRLGYTVLAARRADEALHLAEAYGEHIDLLLTDVVMPDMNGKELAERIIAVKPGLKCLYMSGYTADVIARQGILEEGIQFIPKPFSLKDLAVKVREVLAQ